MLNLFQKDFFKRHGMNQHRTPILILGDTGSGCCEVLFDRADQAIEAGKSVLFFNSKGDLNSFARLSDLVAHHGRSSSFFVNSYLNDGAPFHERYQRPDWEFAVSGGAIVCTVFPSLEQAPKTLREEEEKILARALMAVQNTANKEATVILIGDIGYFGRGIQEALASLANDGVEVVMTSSYASQMQGLVAFDYHCARVVLMQAGTLSDADILFDCDNTVVSRIRMLESGDGFEIASESKGLLDVKFSYVERKHQEKLVFANSSRA